MSMESPERRESIPATVDQGSPFFKFLCGLSPIKPTRSVHVVQTYAELSLPPPPAVFTSPANPLKCGGRSKRSLVVSRTASTHVTVEAVGVLGNTWGGGKENQPNESYVPKRFVAAQSVDLPSSQGSECSRKPFMCAKGDQEQGIAASDDTPTKYGDVSDYLADPSEGVYAAASSSQLLGQSCSHRSPLSPDNYGFHEDEYQNATVNNEENVLAGHQELADHCDASNVEQRNLDAIQRLSGLKRRQMGEVSKTEGSLPPRDRGVADMGHEGGGNAAAEQPAHVDQGITTMAFLVGHADGEGSRNVWAPGLSSLSKLSREPISDFSAIDRLSKFVQLKTREDFELAASKALNNQRISDEDSRERDLEDKKDVLGGGIAGQRGVRRRCLDFEASSRRKSMGGGSSRRTSALRSKGVSGSSAMTSCSSIPPSILCERAVATSDATNSAAATPLDLDLHSDMSMGPECTSADGRLLSPMLPRISRSSLQRNVGLLSADQSSADQSRAGRDLPSSVGIPSGIGLHLNSLTGSISFSPTNREFKQAMGMSSTSKGAVASLLGMPGLVGPNSGNRCEEFGNVELGVGAASNDFGMAPATSNFETEVVISVTERSRVTLRETLPMTDISRGASKSNTLRPPPLSGRQSLDGSGSSRANSLEKKFGSGGKKRLLHQDVVNQTTVECADEYDSPRSQKKRKSPTASGEKSGEGCKRCNCKKSKCLKLYCECFAAGTYCVGSCTCHDCFNKPEHEETVLSTRQQIELRNPLAFAPKIIHSAEASPKRGEEVIETPASARHKRGCNCKKSLCLKKYCECYQAGVGCSEGCRCEGCRNMYGRKEAIEDSGKETASDALESGSMEDDLELIGTQFQGVVGTVDQQRNNGKDLSPITPSCQYTTQVRSTGRVRSAGKKRSCSPMSQLKSAAKPVRSPDCATWSAVKFQSNINSAHQTPDLRGVASPVSTPKLSRGNQLSPRWDGLGDICTLTPLPQPPLRPTPASLSTLDRTGASPSFSCQSIEPMSSYQNDKLDSVSKCSPPPFQQASDHSPLSSFGLRDPLNMNLCSAHCTAALSSQTYEAKVNAKAGDALSAHVSFTCDDDDTPDFLKYTDSINSPVITKSVSPKQKRVSPPHIEEMREKSRDGMLVFDPSVRSSPGLRSGRKFILQALPSLPPAMPLANNCQGQASNCSKQV